MDQWSRHCLSSGVLLNTPSLAPAFHQRMSQCCNNKTSRDGCSTGARQPVSFCNVSLAHQDSRASVVSSDLFSQPSRSYRRGQAAWRWLCFDGDDLDRCRGGFTRRCLVLSLPLPDWRYLDSVCVCKSWIGCSGAWYRHQQEAPGPPYLRTSVKLWLWPQLWVTVC